MAYDDPLPPPPGAGSSYSGKRGGSILEKIKAHSEMIIPAILVILLIIFLAVYFGFIQANSIPLIGPLLSDLFGSKKTILFIGNPVEAPGFGANYENGSFLKLLEEGDKARRYTVQHRTPLDFTDNAYNRIRSFDLVIIDQSADSDKSIPLSLAEALVKYLKSGGKVIIVGDSATRVRERHDRVGLPAVLNESIAPVDCYTSIEDLTPPCTEPIAISGIWYSESDLFTGVEHIPTNIAQNPQGYPFTVFNVQSTVASGKGELAYIKDTVSYKSYPAIVEKSVGLGGKIVYINYYELYNTPVVVDKLIPHLIG